MTNKKLFDSMRDIDEKYILDAAPQEKSKLIRTKKRIFIPIAAILACALIFSAVALPMLFREEPPPVYEDAWLTATEASGAFFSGDDEAAPGATTAYTTVKRDPNNPFVSSTLPTGYATVYNINKRPTKTPLDKSELYALANKITPKAAALLGCSLEASTVQETEDDWRIQITRSFDKYSLEARQVDNVGKYSDDYSYNSIRISNSVDGSTASFTVNGKKLSVRKDATDAEILESLAWLKPILFDLFEVEFDSVYISTLYNSFDIDDGGANSVEIYYYNSSDGLYMGDCIRLNFGQPYESDKRENELLEKVSISYEQRRTPREETYKAVAKCKLISLEDAEKLLNNGYVFGGHSCMICMSMQTPITFDSYDHVEYEYVIGDKWVIPFYTFYKKLGIAKNGNTIYAKTHVCAVAVKGYEEYYELQNKYHEYWGSLENIYNPHKRYEDIDWFTSVSIGEKTDAKKEVSLSELRFPVDENCAILVAKAGIFPYSSVTTMDGRTYRLIEMEVVDPLNSGFNGSFLYAMPEDIACDLSVYDALLLAITPQTESLYTDDVYHSFFRVDRVFHAVDDAPEQWNIIPFTKGMFDASLWENDGWEYAYLAFDTLIDYERQFDSDTSYDEAIAYVTESREGKKDISLVPDFKYAEASEAIYYTEPFYYGYFDVSFDGEEFLATRYINGCRTSEQIRVYREDGVEKVEYAEHQFFTKDMKDLIDLGAYIKSLDLTKYSPKNIDTSSSDLAESYCRASGWYEKTEDGVEQIIRIYWEYFNRETEELLRDDLYLRYNGNTFDTLSQDELREIIGDSDLFTALAQ